MTVRLISLQTVFPTAGDTLALESHQTTGSMSAASQTLTVASNPGFQIGDAIIVEIGGESGGGLRGTKGVGGVWPALSYANAAAMNADTGQAADTYAWLLDTGTVYQYAASVWTQTAVTQYYIQKAIPRSLVTTITNIVGTTFTLAAASVVATTNAYVYFDNRAIINDALESGEPNPTGLNYIIPAGSYAISGRIRMANHDGWTVRGAGKDLSEIFSPGGVDSAQFLIASCDSVVLRDFALRGNCGLHGFGLAWSTSQVTETLVTQGDAYPRGIWCQTATGVLMQNLKVSDCFHMALGAQYTTGISVKNCEIYLNAPMPQYIQWQFNFPTCEQAYASDILIDSAYMTGGFEIYAGSGEYLRITCRNATCSLNSAGRWKVKDCTFTLESGAQYPLVSPQATPGWSISNFVISVNSNVGNSPLVAQGGTIENCDIVYEGYQNVADSACNPPIVVGSNNHNVRVIGGTIEHPNVNVATGFGVITQGNSTYVDGLTIVGENSAAGWGNIVVEAPAQFATVKNCVAHTYNDRGTQTTLSNNTFTVQDSTPNAFSFTDVGSAALSTVYETAAFIVWGLSTSVAVSITGGEYSKNGAAYTSGAGTVVMRDTLKVRGTSSGSNSTAVDVVLTVGGVSDVFTITTEAVGGGPLMDFSDETNSMYVALLEAA